jgi:hypothetical protein
MVPKNAFSFTAVAMDRQSLSTGGVLYFLVVCLVIPVVLYVLRLETIIVQCRPPFHLIVYVIITIIEIGMLHTCKEQ